MAVKILYDVIKEKRSELGLSQQELSNQSGVNINIIKALETGRTNTTKVNTRQIVNILGLDIDEIYIEDFRDTKVIAIANNKGGSSKTSVCSGLGYALSEIKGNRILLIDADMQMNLSYSFGFDRNEKVSLDAALRKEESLLNYIHKTSIENIDIIISDFRMATMEMAMFQKTLRETVFARLLKPVINAGIYDYIIIDTNPTLGMLNHNVLNASDHVIIPVELSIFGLKGLEIILNFIDEVKVINNNLNILGVLKTKVDVRESVTQKADNILTEEVGELVLNTSIAVDTNIKKSQWECDPTLLFKINSRGADQYRDLAKEVIKVVR